jgi:hypothetical protein
MIVFNLLSIPDCQAHICSQPTVSVCDCPRPFVIAENLLSVFPAEVLLANDLDQHPLGAPAIELAVENLLPGAKIQVAFGDGHDHFTAHDLAL